MPSQLCCKIQPVVVNFITFLLDLSLIMTGEIRAEVHSSVVQKYKDEFVLGCIAVLRQVLLLHSDLIVFLYRH